MATTTKPILDLDGLEYFKGEYDKYTKSELDKKVDKVSGKGLSTNDYTTAEKNKLAGIANGANKTTVDSALSSTSTNPVQNKVINSALSGKANTSHKHNSADINSLDASKLTGTIDIARLPQGALDRLVRVADDTARFALTTSDIQLGDTVQTTNNGKMYYVVDETKLSSADGYAPYTADSATSVPWSGVTGKPSSYTPSVHTHDDRYYTETEMNAKLNGKVDLSADGVSKAINQLTTGSSTPSDADYYVSQYIGGGTTTVTYHRRPMSALWAYIKGKADSVYAKASHTHTKSQITDFPTSMPANGGNSSTVNGHSVNIDVPSNAKFTDTVYTHPTTSGNKHIPSGGSSGQILRWSADGTAVWGADNNTTYSNFVKSGSGAKAGLVPAPSTTAGTTKYLREDGTWAVPPDNNTTYSNMGAATASAAGKSGLVPAPAAGKQRQYLRGDGTWATPTNTTYSVASQSANGLMSAADKKKLDGIASGTTSGNKTAYQTTEPTGQAVNDDWLQEY